MAAKRTKNLSKTEKWMHILQRYLELLDMSCGAASRQMCNDSAYDEDPECRP